MNKTHRVLLFYKYVTIENPQTFRDEHLKFCKELGILGRILVSKEGINGTVSGTAEQTDDYMYHMHQDSRFSDLWFKIDEAEDHAFTKMHVRAKRELVNLSLEADVNPLELTGKHLNPKQWYQAMNDDDTIVIDARNDYEYDLGHFKGAIKPEIQNFRQLPDWIRENKALLEGKKILTYCTGGVRCEKFSGWLKKEGFEDVSQLEGGIVTYGKDETTKGKDWQGALYVFDNRISVPVNRVEHIVVGKDYFTGEPTERYINCGNPDCNKQILATENNEAYYLGSCCEACRLHPRNRYVIAHNLTHEYVLSRVAELNKQKHAEVEISI